MTWIEIRGAATEDAQLSILGAKEVVLLNILNATSFTFRNSPKVPKKAESKQKVSKRQFKKVLDQQRSPRVKVY